MMKAPGNRHTDIFHSLLMDVLSISHRVAEHEYRIVSDHNHNLYIGETKTPLQEGDNIIEIPLIVVMVVLIVFLLRSITSSSDIQAAERLLNHL